MLLSVSAVVSMRTVQTLEMLIASHNKDYCVLYEYDSFKPKFHYLIHYPDQIVNFGPMRNHWCMRYESKNGFFRQKRWFNFRNLPKSLAIYHQQWMSMNMSGPNGSRSEIYLYRGDEIKDGIMTTVGDIAILHGYAESSKTVLRTESVVINGLTYCKGMIILIDFVEEPEFAAISSILIVDHEKFFECKNAMINTFNCHMNMFAITITDESALLRAVDLRYKWPQIKHTVFGETLVMLTN